MDYRWFLFLHVGVVLVFMLLHGVHVTVTWKKRWQSDPSQHLALFEPLSDVRWLRYSALGVVGSGLLLVALLNAWTAIWIWASLALLVVIWLTMYVWGGAYYNATQQTAEAALAASGTPTEAETRAAFDRARMSWLVPAMTVVGLGGVGVILWLMVFRPG
jgi:hypothetical protein